MSTTRHSFRHQGQTVYEWDQTLRCVTYMVFLDSSVAADMTMESLWTIVGNGGWLGGKSASVALYMTLLGFLLHLIHL